MVLEVADNVVARVTGRTSQAASVEARETEAGGSVEEGIGADGARHWSRSMKNSLWGLQGVVVRAFGGEDRSVGGVVDCRVCRKWRCAFLGGSQSGGMIDVVALAVVGRSRKDLVGMGVAVTASDFGEEASRLGREVGSLDEVAVGYMAFRRWEAVHLERVRIVFKQ